MYKIMYAYMYSTYFIHNAESYRGLVYSSSSTVALGL